MTERLHFHFSLSCIGEGSGNPLQCSCLESPRNGGAWWAAVYGVAQSRTRLKWLSSSSSSSSSSSKASTARMNRFLGFGVTCSMPVSLGQGTLLTLKTRKESMLLTAHVKGTGSQNYLSWKFWMTLPLVRGQRNYTHTLVYNRSERAKF